MTDTRKPTPVEAAVSRLVEAETALDALRKVLDRHRGASRCGLASRELPETDEEVIARLAKAAEKAGASVEDETGRPLGKTMGRNRDGAIVVLTCDAVGRSYAEGHAAGMESGRILGRAQYDGVDVRMLANDLAFAADRFPDVGGRAVDVEHRIRVVFGLPKMEADAALNPPAPKPVRLHAGQTWRHPDGGETCIAYLGPGGGVGLYGFGGFTMDIGPDWTVINARGSVLIAGPGFTG